MGDSCGSPFNTRDTPGSAPAGLFLTGPGAGRGSRFPGAFPHTGPSAHLPRVLGTWEVGPAVGVTDTWLSWHHLGTPSPRTNAGDRLEAGPPPGQMPACPCLHLPSSVALGRVTGQATPGSVPSTPTCSLFNLTNTLQLPRWDGARHTNGKRNQTEREEKPRGGCLLPSARCQEGRWQARKGQRCPRSKH